MKKKVNKMRVAAVLLTCSMFLTGCGSSQEKETYTSPNFSKEDETTEADDAAEDADKLLLTDTDGTVITYSSLSDSEPVWEPEAYELDGQIVDTSSAPIVGYISDDVYYNSFDGFALETDGDNWRLYNAYQTSQVTDFTEEEVNAIWNGTKSPYYLETTPCAIGYHFQSGSSIVVSYINPDLFYMKGLSAENYLEMAAEGYEDATVIKTTYLGKEYWVLDLSEEQTGIGRSVKFATDVEDLIVTITYTLQDDMTLNEMADHLVQLQ